MEKKILALLLCACLLFSTALAETVSVATETTVAVNGVAIGGDDSSESKQVTSMASANGLLYVLYDQGTLVQIKPDTREETKLGDVFNSAWYSAAEDLPQEENAKLPMNLLFAQDNVLYGLCTLTGQWYSLLDEGGAFAPTEMPIRLDMSGLYDTTDGNNDYSQPSDLCVSDGALFFLTNVNTASRDAGFFSISLQSGEMTKYETKNLNSFTPYQDGLLLACQFDIRTLYTTGELDTPATYGTFDPKTDTFTELGTFDDTGVLGGYGIGALRYGNGSLYYPNGSRIEGCDVATGETRTSAYTGAGMFGSYDYSYSCYVEGGYLARGGYGGWVIYALDTDAVKNGALRIFGEMGSEAHKTFSQNYPDIPVDVASDYSNDLEALTTAMVSGSDAYDVLNLSTSYMPVQSLIDKGYCEDLSVYPEIMERVAKLDSAFADVMRVDGKLYGVPVSVSAYAYGVNMEKWTELGLTEDDVPTNWIDFCDFLANYQYDYGDDNPDLRVFDNGDSDSLRMMIFAQMMNAVILDAEKRGEELSFDNDRVREVFGAFEQIDFSELTMGDPSSQDYWTQPYLFASYSAITSLSSRAYATDVPMPLALMRGEEPLIAANATALTINPKSARKDDAVKYVCNYLDNLDNETSIVLHPDDNEPREEAQIVKSIAENQKELEDKQSKLESADEDQKAILHDDIKLLQQNIEEMEKWRYSISAETIADYREKYAPLLVLAPQSVLYSGDSNSANELSKLMEQYLSGTMSLDGYLKEMDKRLRMMQLENQ